ncbi:hypothetical protein VB834_14870 [Limnoraphis robusta Tam1]|uniref:Uncharacterized protein n=1 Tax=Limnoraphis robusta CCNP1315 TaxID=3110306 RepID=A0ABU5U3Y5_9CYAN|nr:hypothetical protein [Limnoraphis robusta]MEA5498284.1 hypothetical protein [Limnoraphis robusta BA-68 BA1]MEA5521358.1 hypothetical protein [Limnoraphis robusta CCNP1315]MEA5540307.1 hypothetical protein [Limnoraphis robusta Tam1]MEA5547965.1 hypothetical protein [Limnoraphis robusta CCNP1324]
MTYFKQTTSSLDKECHDLGVYAYGGLETEKLFKTNTGLAVRLAYRVFEKYQFKYDCLHRNREPERGAHAMMFALVFLMIMAVYVDKNNVNWEAEILKLVQNEHEVVAQEFTKNLLRQCYLAILEGLPKENVKIIESASTRAVNKMLRATKMSPFDDAYTARSAFLKMFDSTYESLFTNASVSFLEIENIDYCEMSQPSDKIPNHILNSKTNLRWLALVASHRRYLAGKDKPENAFNKDLDDAIQKMQEFPSKIVGIDLAGPEGYTYDYELTKQLVHTVLERLKEYINKSGNERVKRVIFRPHVGEGSSLLDVGTTLIEKNPQEFVKRVLRTILKLKSNNVQIDGTYIRRILEEVDAQCVGV